LIPILFAGIIYTLGTLPVLLFSSFFPFLIGKEYIFIFIFFVFCLKIWAQKRWNQKHIWKNLGFTQFKDNLFFHQFNKELFKSFFIILFWSLLLIFGKFVRFKSGIHISILFDILFTSIFVGIAEELLFRVWLFEELKLFFSINKAIFLQSFLFSLVHPYDFGESFTVNFLMKIGLFLLGTYLNLLRINNSSNIFPSIAFHGGIVAFIFLGKSIFELQGNYPFLIYGNQYENFINPVSGLIGISTLFLLNIFQIKILKKFST
tara:strand:- start:613 stop:1398 length:786 start_codon:yes stop_codon:yes gene_type:complete